VISLSATIEIYFAAAPGIIVVTFESAFANPLASAAS